LGEDNNERDLRDKLKLVLSRRIQQCYCMCF